MSLSIVISIMLGGIWLLLTGRFDLGHGLWGLLFGAVYVVATRAGLGRAVRPSELPKRMGYLVLYLLVLLPVDLMVSNWMLARKLLHRSPALQSGIVRVRMESLGKTASALEQFAITLTPGQMIVDYEEEAGVAYVHLLDIGDLREQEEGSWRRHRLLLKRIFS